MPARIHLLGRIFWRRLLLNQGLILRGLLCWVLGSIILINDETSSFDSRFQLRGQQKSSSQIVLITLHNQDMNEGPKYKSKSFAALHETNDITESYFWNADIWSDLLIRILQQKPRKIGVTLYFPETLNNANVPLFQTQIFQRPEIVWATHESLSDRINQPLNANSIHTNIGLVSFHRDEDGIIRRFSPAMENFVANTTDIEFKNQNTRLINFRGSGVFAEFSLKDIIEDRVPKDFLKDKIVLIGASSQSSTQYLTPLGPSTKHEVLAQIIDNALENRWIFRAQLFVYILYLLPLLLISIYIINNYPQTVAFVFMLWTATLTTALSAWVFDNFSVWLPAISTCVQIITTWVIFIGYQANLIENKNYQLQQESRYLHDLEQLKNNFVSLISHDLKTPIAKIQAVVDRMMLDSQAQHFAADLKSLRVSSEELNKYIQSILKVLRVESRDFKLNREVGDINEAIEEAMNQLQPLAAEKGIQISSELEPMFSIEADFTLMKEVLINLIENAIKYTPAFGKVHVKSFETSEKIWVEVQDTGAGISADEMPNVWGKFVRGKDQDHKTKGSGLGLYLVKYFIELHGGQVSLESSLGRGTKVAFSLPINEEPSPDSDHLADSNEATI